MPPFYSPPESAHSQFRARGLRVPNSSVADRPRSSVRSSPRRQIIPRAPRRQRTRAIVNGTMAGRNPASFRSARPASRREAGRSVVVVDEQDGAVGQRTRDEQAFHPTSALLHDREVACDRYPRGEYTVVVMLQGRSQYGALSNASSGRIVAALSCAAVLLSCEPTTGIRVHINSDLDEGIELRAVRVLVRTPGLDSPRWTKSSGSTVRSSSVPEAKAARQHGSQSSRSRSRSRPTRHSRHTRGAGWRSKPAPSSPRISATTTRIP